ncbi:MAG: phage holin [Clostridia bacterium]|nr:phage holin [Clostridia bacterium]
MKISASTVARTIVLAIALTNQILTASGINPLPFAEETVYELLTALFTLGAAAVAWWKNNSFTAEAIEADEYMNILKENRGREDLWE